jgi:hypothetical protein
MPVKPTLLLTTGGDPWAENGDKSNPSSAKIDTGYTLEEKPSRQELNGLLHNIFAFLNFIDLGGTTGIIRFDTIELLSAIDDTEYLDLQHFIVSGFGIYQLDQSDTTSLADGENTIELLSGSRLHRIIYDVDTMLGLFESKLSNLFSEIEKIEVVDTILRDVIELDFGSISANTTSELTFNMLGARKEDIVQITPQTGLTSGISIAYAYVSSDDIVTLRLANNTVGSINPTSTKFNVIVIK